MIRPYDASTMRGRLFRDVSLVVLGGAMVLLPGATLDAFFASTEAGWTAQCDWIALSHLLSIVGLGYLSLRAARWHQLDVVVLVSVVALMTITRLIALGT